MEIREQFEKCVICDEPTGGSGKGEDSLYLGDYGPYCEECWDEGIMVKSRDKEIRKDLLIILKSIQAKDYIAAEELLSEMLEDGE